MWRFAPLVDFANSMLTWHFKTDEFGGVAGVGLPASGIPLEGPYRRRHTERLHAR